MTEEFTISIFSENRIGLLNRITIIFTRRKLNIESLTVSESAIHGIHKFTIVVNSTEDKIKAVTKQIEKLVEVLKAYYYRNEDIVHEEIALYKVPTEALMNSNKIEELVRKHNARILEVTPTYTVIEKTGHQAETNALFKALNEFKVLQFTRSGRIAITKDNVEFLSNFIKEREKHKESLNLN
jgi:acetolactate synthase-1/3 small subunit